jgi:hypothetical protein
VMTFRQLCSLLAIIVLAGCQWFQPMQDGSAIDLREARRVGDAFMGDIIADNVAQALTRMETGFADSMPAGQAEQGIRQLLDYCGQPVDLEYKATQVGFKAYLNGTKKPMRKLFYAAATTTEAKGVCFFAVEIVPDGKDLKVTLFGPLKLQRGTLPDWLK